MFDVWPAAATAHGEGEVPAVLHIWSETRVVPFRVGVVYLALPCRNCRSLKCDGAGLLPLHRMTMN